jgi:hypothetical protein
MCRHLGCVTPTCYSLLTISFLRQRCSVTRLRGSCFSRASYRKGFAACKSRCRSDGSNEAQPLLASALSGGDNGAITRSNRISDPVPRHPTLRRIGTHHPSRKARTVLHPPTLRLAFGPDRRSISMTIRSKTEWSAAVRLTPIAQMAAYSLMS